MNNFRIALRGLVYREDKWWISHCLELDIVAEGDTSDDAVESCMRLCELQISEAIKTEDLDSIFRPAPPEYWRMYWQGVDVEVPQVMPKRESRPGKMRVGKEHFQLRQLQLA